MEKYQHKLCAMSSWHSPHGIGGNNSSAYYSDGQLEHIVDSEAKMLSLDDKNSMSNSENTKQQRYVEKFDCNSCEIYEENCDTNDSSASMSENVISLDDRDDINKGTNESIQNANTSLSEIDDSMQMNAVKFTSTGIKAINAKKCGLLSSYFICSSEGCISTSKSHLLYPFPKSPRIALSWLQRCGRENLVHHLGMNGSVPNNFLLCEKHFEKDQFLENTDTKELKKIAMPSLFLPSNSSGNGVLKAQSVVSKDKRMPKNAAGESNSCDESYLSPIPQSYNITFVTEHGTVPIDSALPKVAAVLLTPLTPSLFTTEFCKENDLSLQCAQSCKTALEDFGTIRPPHTDAELTLCLQHLAIKQQNELAKVGSINMYVSPQLRKKHGFFKPGPSSSKMKTKSTKQTFPSSAEMQRKHCADSFCSADKDAVLFFFPISEDLCRAWMENIGDPGLLHLSRKHGYHCWHKAMTLCSDHFQPNCYQARRGRLRLVPNAVPTIFSHGLLTHPCRYVGHKPSVKDILCGHESCLAVAKKPWQSVEEANYLKKRRKWIERMKCLANEASDEEDYTQHKKRHPVSHDAGGDGKIASRESDSRKYGQDQLSGDESSLDMNNGNTERVEAGEILDTTCPEEESDFKPVLEDPLFMRRAIKRFCDEQELQVFKKQKVEASQLTVTSRYVRRAPKSYSRYPLREESEKKIDLKQLSELDSEVKYLRKQLNILNSEHVRLRSAVFRASKNVRLEARMPLSLFFTPKDAFESFKDKLDPFAYGFIHQQQTHYSRPHWDPRSAKIPILMSRCSVRVWEVLQTLFKLPCKPSLFKYKAAARKDPSIFENSALMNEFVQKSYKSRFKRAKPRQYVRKNSLTGMTVSDVLENYLKKHDIVPEV